MLETIAVGGAADSLAWHCLVRYVIVHLYCVVFPGQKTHSPRSIASHCTAVSHVLVLRTVLASVESYGEMSLFWEDGL